MPGGTEISLDGSGLTIEDLVRVARDPGVTITCDDAAMGRTATAAALVSETVERYRRELDGDPILDYGITTGFGEFKRIPIDPNDLFKLQGNILLSHAAGVGENIAADDLANYFSPEVVRA